MIEQHCQVRSSLVTQAAIFAHRYDRAVDLRAVLGEPVEGAGPWQERVRRTSQGRATDCRCVYEVTEEDTPMPQDNRVVLDLHDIRQHVREDTLECTPTCMFVANQLTKRRPWLGPLVSAGNGQVARCESEQVASSRATGPSRHRRGECASIDNMAIFPFGR